MLLLKLALRPWRLAPASHVFSSIAVGFLLLLVGFLFWMQSGLRPLVARLQGEQVVTAYLDPAVDAKDEGRITDAIRASLGAHAETTEIRAVGARQFVENLKGPYPELSRELEDLGSEMSSVVPRYVSVSGMLPDQAVEKIRLVPGIESAETSKDRYAQIVGAFRALRWVSRILIVGVCLALFTGLILLSRMNSYLHREVLNILRLWGASEAELRLPSMLSGALVGASGGLIAFAGWLTAGRWMAQEIRALSPILHDLPPATPQLALILLGIGLGIGLFAGALASAFHASEAASGAAHAAPVGR